MDLATSATALLSRRDDSGDKNTGERLLELLKNPFADQV